MSTPLAVSIIVALDLALIMTLAFVMSRALKLTPHRAAGAQLGYADDWLQLPPAPRRQSRAYQTPTPISTHTGSASESTEPAKKSAATVKTAHSL